MAKVVRLAGGQMADVAHRLAQFLPGLIQLRQPVGFHINLVNVGTFPNDRQRFPDGNDDAVVQAPAQHGPLFFQHAHDLKRLVFNFDAFAEG